MTGLRFRWPRYLAFARVGMIIVGVAALAGVITAVVSLKVFLSLQPIDGLIVVAGGGALGAQAVRIRRIRITTDESEILWQGVFQRKWLRRGPTA